MMKIDIRFKKEDCQEMIGARLTKYRCDEFDFTNSVTQMVGLYIGNQVFSLTNIQESVNYFGNCDDIGIFRLNHCREDDIHSAFENQRQIDTPVLEIIKSIKLVNECQRIFESGLLKHEVWLTRAIIFCLDMREISFEKDNVPFSEEIIIRRGYDLENMLSDEKDFLEGWDESVTPECIRAIIEIN